MEFAIVVTVTDLVTDLGHGSGQYIRNVAAQDIPARPSLSLLSNGHLLRAKLGR